MLQKLHKIGTRKIINETISSKIIQDSSISHNQTENFTYHEHIDGNNSHIITKWKILRMKLN